MLVVKIRKIRKRPIESSGLDIQCWPFFKEKGEFDSGFMNVPGECLMSYMSILYYDNREYTGK
jgi:hypothetical protein